MCKRILCLLAALLCLVPNAFAAQTAYDDALVAHLYELMSQEESDDPGYLYGVTQDVRWRTGGSTDDLLADKQWDVALVKASEVDLQRLYEADLLANRSMSLSSTNWWLLPAEYRAMIPLDDRTGGYDYPLASVAYKEDGEIYLVLVRNRPLENKHRFLAETYAGAFMGYRTPEQRASVEILTYLNASSQEEVLAGNWDIALIDTTEVDLAVLDQAGLLYDLRSHPRLDIAYSLLTDDARARYTAADGRFLSLPYWFEWCGWIVNARSAHLWEAMDALARSENDLGLGLKGTVNVFHDLAVSRYATIGGYDADVVEIPYGAEVMAKMKTKAGKRMLFNHAKDERLAAYVAQLPADMRDTVTDSKGKILAIPCYDPYGEVVMIMRNRDQPAHEDQPALDFMVDYLEDHGIWAK